VATTSVRARDRVVSLWMSARLLPRADVLGILTAAGILAALACGWWLSPSSMRATNFGFGAEWDCASPGKGGPVCIKR
jgi:hypothetical protein